jgi:cytochrome c5
MKSRWFAVLIGVALASVTTVSAQNAKLVEEGKKVYEAYNCKKCHRIDNVGSKISPLDGVATKLSAEDLKKWLVDPEAMTAKMAKKPTIKMKRTEFKPGEVDALMAYMLTLK